MKSKTQVLAGVIFGVLLCLALPAVGQNSNLSFNGGYQGDVWCGGSEGCVATGFYDGTINGQQVGPGGAGGLGMICDDYSHNIHTGQSWSANGINVSQLAVGNNINNTQFGGAIGIAGYTELAYVVNLMFTTNPSSAQQSIYSQVIWALTGGLSYSQLSSAAQSLYTWVKNNGSLPSLSTYVNLMLYTPSDQTLGGPQEMWGQNMQAAEGGAAFLYMLMAGAACFVAIRGSRSQRAKRALA